MLEGSIAALGSHYVVTLTATDCQTGEAFARTQAEATSKERVLAELGAISSSMRTKLGESLPSIRGSTPIEQATTPSLAALKAYTLGQEERRRGRELVGGVFQPGDRERSRVRRGLHHAVDGLRQPRRVAAQRGVREGQRGDQTAQRARAALDRLPVHDRVTGNQDSAAEALELWKAAYPRDFRPVNALAVIYNRTGRMIGRSPRRRKPCDESGPSISAVEPAFAFRALGRDADARGPPRKLCKLGVETDADPAAPVSTRARRATAPPRPTWPGRRAPREFDLVSAEAQAAAFEGRLRDAAGLYHAPSTLRWLGS